ncbi:MAG: hypothetical protein ACRDPA_19045 [Solirubrobacteraceae bacterium]
MSAINLVCKQGQRVQCHARRACRRTLERTSVRGRQHIDLARPESHCVAIGVFFATPPSIKGTILPRSPGGV